jgi:hypothetical protein
MENKLKIGLIVAIAFVAGIAGTLSFASFDNSQNVTPQTQPPNQNVGIGAYVIVEAYREDGTLYQKFEGHNALTNLYRNVIVGCTTGLAISPGQFESCNIHANQIILTIHNQTDDSIINPRPIENGTIVELPNGCVSESANGPDNCSGWELTGTFDFNDLSCTPEADCLYVSQISSGNWTDTYARNINFIDLNPDISIAPNDRLFVNMTFNVSP